MMSSCWSACAQNVDTTRLPPVAESVRASSPASLASEASDADRFTRRQPRAQALIATATTEQAKVKACRRPSPKFRRKIR